MRKTYPPRSYVRDFISVSGWFDVIAEHGCATMSRGDVLLSQGTAAVPQEALQ